MNADASAGVDVDLVLAAKTASLLPGGLGLIAFALVSLAAAAFFLRSASRRPPPNRSVLVRAWSDERDAARAARRGGDVAGEWEHLQRAHILSQPMAVPHVRTHVAMISCGVRRHDAREVAGQVLRLLLAAPGSLSGRYPVGNTGGADVSAFLPMPIPDDLRAVLEGSTPLEAVR
jgi:hypothetical protein